MIAMSAPTHMPALASPHGAAWRAAGSAANDNHISARRDNAAAWPCALQDWLDDPLTRLVMHADHVSTSAILEVVCTVCIARSARDRPVW
jgi:hypothetical protein